MEPKQIKLFNIQKKANAFLAKEAEENTDLVIDDIKFSNGVIMVVYRGTYDE